jgi:uncharacterized protein (TIGR01319 family)
MPAGVVLCVDVGSTFTKGVLVDVRDGAQLASASSPTTLAEVLDGLEAVRSTVAAAAGVPPPDEILACSSAGGGLRLAVVGYEELVTAEAGRRVALSAGGRVVHLAAGPLDGEGVSRLKAARPDLIVLTGGTDGGNADVLVHNARRLATGRVVAPVVLAGNAAAAADAAAELSRRGRTVTMTANVLPRIGTLDPLPARAAIRLAFLEHVIGGKGLSRATARVAGRTFAELVKAPTPDAVLTGVGLLAGGDDVLVADVGGATTDVYSVVDPARSKQPADVVEPLWQARTVEGDVGLRWSAVGVVEAARSEGLLAGGERELEQYARMLAEEPGFVPDDRAGRDGDERLASLAALIAVRRHGRPDGPGGRPRPLRDVGLVIGGGGVLRHADPGARERILRPLLSDQAGGWTVPDRARLAVDVRHTLFAVGLLAPQYPAAAAHLARSGLDVLR